jgi:hypothetical protein
MGPHRIGGDQATFDQMMRIVPHDLAVLARSGLRLVGIDDEIGRARVALGHERPLETGREARATAPPQPRGLDLVDDPIVALVHDALGVVPETAFARSGQARVVKAVDIGEDTVFVSEHLVYPPQVREGSGISKEEGR